MPKKKNADGAGPVTPVKAQSPAARRTAPGSCPDCKCEGRCLKATRSLHKTALAIARTHAWESVLTANLRPILATVVIVIAIVCGEQMPLGWTVAGILGGALAYRA